jgi:hypothetical protein
MVLIIVRVVAAAAEDPDTMNTGMIHDRQNTRIEKVIATIQRINMIEEIMMNENIKSAKSAVQKHRKNCVNVRPAVHPNEKKRFRKLRLTI